MFFVSGDMKVFAFWIFFFGICLGIPALGQTCTANGCDSLSVADLRDELSSWQTASSDCNDDGELDIRDFVCMLNSVSDLNPPELSAIGNQTVDVGQTLSFSLMAVDPNEDPLSYHYDPPLDNVVLDWNTGFFTFTPSQAQRGEHLLRFTVSDGFLNDQETISIQVLGVVADDQDLETAEDISLNITLTASKISGSVSFDIVELPGHGAISGEPPELTYFPETNYTGTDSFRFTATDDLGTSSPGIIRIELLAVNDAPVALDGQVVAAVETPRDILLDGVRRPHKRL